MQKITPYLWFDKDAEAAANFYASVFSNTTVGNRMLSPADNPSTKEGEVLTVSFKIDGYEIVGLNGGPTFKINPSISFFYHCKDEAEIDELWAKLIDGGKALMELGKYDFADKYGWLEDKFGVSWQLILGDTESTQRVVPSLLYVGDQNGRAEEAVKLYTSLFQNSEIKSLDKYPAGFPGESENGVMYSLFTLEGEEFTAMDSGQQHEFAFNEGVSLMVLCADQEEVDHFWNKLTADGGEESMCGWLKDKFGVSWQIVPKALEEMTGDTANPDKARAATLAMLEMQKIIVADIQAAYDQA